MNDRSHPGASDPSDDRDPVLSAAGARLRARSRAVAAPAVESAVWRRRARRYGAVAAVSLVAVAVLGGALYAQRNDDSGSEVATDRPGAPSRDEVDRIVASLDEQPVDPTNVRLVSTVSTFANCDALVDDLRRVGAQHVGSRGFGASSFMPFYGDGDEAMARDAASSEGAATAAPVAGDMAMTGGGDETTLGTNVQVEGVDELDIVKAVGNLIYDLDRKGNLRITDARSLQVVSTLDVTPGAGDEGSRYGPRGGSWASQLLVHDGQVLVFGTEVEVSEPVEGDPSATRASTSYMTVTFVDAADPAVPAVTDRVRVEGSLVSARLVGGEVRLVTASDMADLGFLMPTTPDSVVKALDANRRSVASSTAPDWIPDWQRDGGDPTPLVPCERVHVPDTFAGVAMTSMVSFPAAGSFEPQATSILAPADTLYAGLEKVAISSEVWVDPIDRERLEFDDWQTAIHEFHFTDDAPTYVGSGIVDGSTIGQFAFGEIGGSLAVVTTKGTPWQQDPEVGVDLTILTPAGTDLAETAKVADLADGNGAVTAVRFIEGRVLISTGLFGRELLVIDVSDPTAPRRAGSTQVPGTVGYFHPLPDQKALMVTSRNDEVGEGNDRQMRSWVEAHLLDVSNADAPVLVSKWERPWASDSVAYDHHAFTYWPDRNLAMWGLQNTEWDREDRDNWAVVLGTDGAVTEVAVPVASRPNEVASPCPAVEVTDPDAREMVGPTGVVLRCDDKDLDQVEWPRYECYRIDNGLVARFAPGEEDRASFQMCSPAQRPVVGRVLVVSGRPILLTDQTLEALDPQTFASTAIAYHPSSGGMGY